MPPSGYKKIFGSYYFYRCAIKKPKGTVSRSDYQNLQSLSNRFFEIIMYKM